VSGPVLLDTGPLVAFLNRRDTWHDWSLDLFGRIRPPLLTCEAVLSEAAFLLRQDVRGADGLLALVERGLVTTSHWRLDDEVESLRRLMKRYANVPMSLADACLVRMTETRAGVTVLTLDRDFRVYRRLGRQTIPLITPD
jgi:predicted nucleic acid-binding protein